MKVHAIWSYKIAKSNQTFEMTSAEMTLPEALILAADLEKTGRVKTLEWYDQAGTYWTTKQLIKLNKETETEPQNIVAYFDGGYDVKNKNSGLGVVIYYEQNKKKWRLKANQQNELLIDNNEAEYAALYFLLERLEQLGVHFQSVQINSDSLVVINQLTDEWPCYEEHYIPWYERIKKKEAALGLTIHYTQIKREQNKEADQLATQALQEIVIESHIENPRV
ncbi:reverse transcriptase-like protein [Alkalihalobacillus sp. 1P02AB]|uniref:reverse transcriptase-like protein n=1 Tax=Alkalihalobacillus sp. 1P02AB TaxID=3132260 RepID=UPI0039A6D1F8